MKKNHTDKSDLQTLCKDLGLRFEAQDWGIINADGKRTSEFILYYESHPKLSATQQFELGELIIASGNEFLCDGGVFDEQFGRFLFQNKRALKTHIEYWKNLNDSDQFPIGKWIQNQKFEPTSKLE